MSNKSKFYNVELCSNAMELQKGKREKLLTMKVVDPV